MSKHSKKIPDRWQDYTAVGKRLHGTRFIAFKVPLKQSLNRQLSSSDVFGHWELLDALQRQNQELGLIVDLTFTTRYYKLQDVPESLLFVKIFTAGHEVPSDETILSFKRVVRRFLRDNADNDRLVGVHCTHGLNRTGYLICRYLIDVDGMDPKEAVDLFNSSRGHAIERQNYIEDLRSGPKRSNEGMDESEQEPMRGQAACRPVDDTEDRRPQSNDPRYHSRSFPSRGTNHRSHRRHPDDGLLPNPAFRAPPPSCPPMRPHLHRYQWTPPHPDSEWRRPPRAEGSRSRYPPPRWQEDGWSRRPAPPPPLPLYTPRWTSESTPRWTSESNGSDRPEEDWTRPRMRPQHRYNYDEY